jgi:hypothetical protein
MEAQYQIDTGNPSTGIDLSEQNVLQCSGGSCSGYYLANTLDFLRDWGTPDEACNPYTATDNPCGTGRCPDYLSRTWYITGWTWISTDTANIKNFLHTQGPVMVWMPLFEKSPGVYDLPWYDAAWWQIHFYGHPPTGNYGGHFVVIVGWDDQAPGTGDDYWIVRNSWGTTGGDVNSGYGGYFYMTQDLTNGFFGINQEAAIISGVTPPGPPPPPVVGLKDTDSGIIKAAQNGVYFIYADPYRMVSSTAAWQAAFAAYDATASGIIYGLSTNEQKVCYDSDGSVVVARTGSGQPPNYGEVLVSGKSAVVMGGPIPNWVVDYYERTGQTPLKYNNDPANPGFATQAGVTVASLPASTDFTHNDLFVVMVFQDTNGNFVLIIYGLGWKGTFAGGIYFKEVISKSLASYTGNAYVFQWTDAGSMDGVPHASEITEVYD